MLYAFHLAFGWAPSDGVCAGAHLVVTVVAWRDGGSRRRYMNVRMASRAAEMSSHRSLYLCAHACCRLLHAASRRPHHRHGFQINLPVAVCRAAAPFTACSRRLRRSQPARHLARQPRAAASLFPGQRGSGWGHRVGSRSARGSTSLAYVCRVGASRRSAPDLVPRPPCTSVLLRTCSTHI